jgi:hypothetical protein
VRRIIRRALVLNAILVLSTAAIIAPSFAADNHYPWVIGFIGGVFISLILRVPGAFAEWYLTRRRRAWAAYASHVGSGLLTVLVAVGNHAKPYKGDPFAESLTSPGAAASIVAIYLFLSSGCLVGASLASLTLRTGKSFFQGRKLPRSSFGLPAVQPRGAQVPTSPVDMSQPQAPVAIPRTTPQWPPVQTPGPVRSEHLPSDSAEATTHGAQDKVNHGRRPRENAVRNEVGLALGIVTGLASLVQGVDSHNVGRSVLALAFGGIGLVIIYGISSRKR